MFLHVGFFLHSSTSLSGTFAKRSFLLFNDKDKCFFLSGGEDSTLLSAIDASGSKLSQLWTRWYSHWTEQFCACANNANHSSIRKSWRMKYTHNIYYIYNGFSVYMLNIKPVSSEVLKKYHPRGLRPLGWYFFKTSSLTGFIFSIYTSKPLYIYYIHVRAPIDTLVKWVDSS